LDSLQVRFAVDAQVASFGELEPQQPIGVLVGAALPRGRIKIESKDDMRKRGLPSPDRADAMAIAFAGRTNAAPMNVDSHAGENIMGDLMTKAW
jgi:hypothetical protein